MIVIGLTGSIGAGKSTATRYFKKKEIPVFDADACVHELYQGEAVSLIEAAFPKTVFGGVVDRVALSRCLAGKKELYQKLEQIIHPLVLNKKNAFMQAALAEKAQLCVCDIPLLFETGQQDLCDVVLVIGVEKETQRQRVLKRSGMTAEKLAEILGRQMASDEKCERADYCILNNGTEAEFEQELHKFLICCLEKEGMMSRKPKHSGENGGLKKF